MGFIIITISADCKVHFNANLLIQNQVSTFGLEPTVLYQLGHVFIEQQIEEVWIYKKNLIFVLCVPICLCVTGMVGFGVTFKWLQSSVTVSVAQPHELEKLNIPKGEERLSMIIEEGEPFHKINTKDT